jgi:hypothetical protein
MKVCSTPLLLVLLISSTILPPGAAAASSSATITITAMVINPNFPGGAGGGGAARGGQPTGHSSNDYIPPPGPVNRSVAPQVPVFYGQGPLDTTLSGITREAVIITSLDHGSSLFIPAGVQVLDASGNPITRVSIAPVPGGLGSSSGDPLLFTGRAYDVAPDGARISPPATLTLVVPDSLWGGDSRFFILAQDQNAGSRTGISAILNPGTRNLSCPVSRLGIFGLYSEPPLVPAPLVPIQPVPAIRIETIEQPAQNTIISPFMDLPGYLYSIVVANLSMFFTLSLTAFTAAFAYTRLGLLSRYRTWITLYLISMTGLLWAVFLYTQGGPLPESVFIVTMVTGLNLIVHILRFDRVVMPSPH